MPHAPIRTPHIRPTAVLAALVAVLVSPAPCLARGTGGFLRNWLISAPLPTTKLDEPKLDPAFIAYPGLFAQGKVWRPVEAREDGELDLRALYPSEPASGMALLFTFLEVPADGTYTLRIGSDDAVRVDIDGRTVHTNDTHRPWQADQDVVRVDLAAGWHRVLVRVVNYSGSWGVSVRMADDKNRPVDLVHQTDVPRALLAACRLDEPVGLEERARLSEQLTDDVERLAAELQDARRRLAAAPEGYVTFAEYESARNLGLRFLESMATLWEEGVKDVSDEEALSAASAMAVAAARGFSDLMAADTGQVVAGLQRGHRVWEDLGGAEIARGDLAEATLLVATALDRTRALAARVEKERVRKARLENDIRNYRQREFTLRVVNPEGGPVENAQVEVVQLSHDFTFGCNLFAAGQWSDKRRNELYESRFLHLFNTAVVPAYWSVVEERRGRPDFAAADALVQWTQAHRVRVRLTPVLWSETVPRWVDSLPADQVGPAVQAHVRGLIERYRDRADWWDVITRPGKELRIGAATLDPADVFRWATEARPTGRLTLNVQDPETAADVARRLASKGVRPDAIGLQAHQHEGPWTTDLVQRRIEQAAAAGVPVQISEVTILGGQEGEREQADAVREFYTVAFASKSVSGITWWDLSDRFAWRNAPAGLVRADLSPKPAYEALDHLLNHLWRTDAAGRTNEDGKVTVRAFYGQYRITVRTGEKRRMAEVHLAADGPGVVEVVLPPGR